MGHDFFKTTQRPRSRGPFRYLEHARKVHKNFLETFEKKFQLKNEEEMKLRMGLKCSDKTSF